MKTLLLPAGTWPWQASFFLEGEYKCGGTVVDQSHVITELGCALSLVSAGPTAFISVLVGQDRRTLFGLSPHSQVRRVVSLKVTSSSSAVLARVSSALQLTHHVAKLCLRHYSPGLAAAGCLVAGASHSSYSTTARVQLAPCADSDQVCISHAHHPPELPINWSGGSNVNYLRSLLH